MVWDESVTQTCTLYQDAKGLFKRKRFALVVIWNSCNQEAPGQQFGTVDLDLSHSSEMKSYGLTKCSDPRALIRLSVTATSSNDKVNSPAAKGSNSSKKPPVGSFAGSDMWSKHDEEGVYTGHRDDDRRRGESKKGDYYDDHYDRDMYDDHRRSPSPENYYNKYNTPGKRSDGSFESSYGRGSGGRGDYDDDYYRRSPDDAYDDDLRRRSGSWDSRDRDRDSDRSPSYDREVGRDQRFDSREREFEGDQELGGSSWGVETEDIDREFMGGSIPIIDDRYNSPSVRNDMHHQFTPSLREGRDSGGKLMPPMGDAWA